MKNVGKKMLGWGEKINVVGQGRFAYEEDFLSIAFSASKFLPWPLLVGKIGSSRTQMVVTTTFVVVCRRNRCSLSMCIFYLECLCMAF